MARGRREAARLIWQGKVFSDDGTTAVNRFFGTSVVSGNVYQGKSWLDGRPSLILDYQGTSLVYGRYRDEIRRGVSRSLSRRDVHAPRRRVRNSTNTSPSRHGRKPGDMRYRLCVFASCTMEIGESPPVPHETRQTPCSTRTRNTNGLLGE